MVRFEKVKIADTTYEAAAVFDVNNDGVLDIVSGEYWFEGPDKEDKEGHFPFILNCGRVCAAVMVCPKPHE